MTFKRMAATTVITPEVPKSKTNWGLQRFIVHAVNDWNSVPEHIKQAETLTRFKSLLATNF